MKIDQTVLEKPNRTESSGSNKLLHLPLRRNKLFWENPKHARIPVTKHFSIYQFE
jgi:hypothetical protein